MNRKVKTLKGTTIQRYKSSVGKKVGSQIYAHRLYNLGIVPYQVWKMAVEIAARENFTFTCFMWDPDARRIRLDEAPDFDTAREPKVGKFLSIHLDKHDNELTVTPGESNAIWHHKWLWVQDNYTRFNVEESWEWSKTYALLLTSPPKGTQRTWLAQLEEAGL